MNISTANANEGPLTRTAVPTGSVKTDTEEPPGHNPAQFRRRFYSQVSDQLWDDWKWQFRNRITTVEQLSKLFSLSHEEQERLKFVTSRYPLSITPYYLSLINQEDPEDPIRKQAVPSVEETALAGMGQEDPLAEKEGSVVPGLVHRYPDRVLMVLTNICPVFCRHCTRKREWQYGGWVRTFEEIERMLDYIQNTPAVRDVIISGGDSLTLSTGRLEKVLMRLRQIEHVEIIRIGTRFPVVLPQRVNDELCSMLSQYGPIWLNTHFNHPHEITPAAAAACDRLLRSGIPVNNQSVLLRGVNDSVET
ncbi:MAG: KamA family radical SAM protein, partial [Pseudomonadota bacterium]